jgi:hypothetical protein
MVVTVSMDEIGGVGMAHSFHGRLEGSERQDDVNMATEYEQ